MRNIENLVGNIYARLTVLEFSHRKTNTYWKCICICGNTCTVNGSSLKNGHTKSCGCFQRDMVAKAVTTHGCAASYRKHYLYRAWIAIKNRCYSKGTKEYQVYGKRGIRMYEKWISDFPLFKSYILKEIGDRTTPKHSIDRIVGKKGYVPGNLRWATQTQQARNRGKMVTRKTTSSYKGVSRPKKSKKWKAYLTLNYKQINLGSYSTELEAAAAYNSGAVEYFGEDARLNIL